MMNVLKASLLAVAFSFFALNVFAQTCGLQPTCEELGYEQTSSDCSGYRWILKCPFDQTKLFCGNSDGGGSGGSLDLEVGAIFYSDKTVSKEYIRSKTPIGVVADTTYRLVLALEETSLTWGGYGTDIPTLSNGVSEVDGKANTAKIIAYGQANNIYYSAARYCNNYTTEGTSAGDWFLPSLAELRSIYANKKAINTTLSLLGRGSLSKELWSSNESNSDNSKTLYMNNGDELFHYKDTQTYVRPVLAL